MSKKNANDSSEFRWGKIFKWISMKVRASCRKFRDSSINKIFERVPRGKSISKHENDPRSISECTFCESTAITQETSGNFLREWEEKSWKCFIVLCVAWKAASSGKWERSAMRMKILWFFRITLHYAKLQSSRWRLKRFHVTDDEEPA